MGLKSRQNAEALESGMFRYLDNNPDEVFKSKDDLMEVASLFKPSINVTVGIKKECNKFKTIYKI